MKMSDIEKIIIEAARAGRHPAMAIEFTNQRFMLVPEDLFFGLIK